MSEENGNKMIGNVIAVVKAPINTNRRIGERIPSKANIDIAIDFLQKWMLEICPSSENDKSFVKVLMSNMINLLYIVKSSTSSEVEDEMLDIVQIIEKVKIALSAEPFNNPSLDGFVAMVRSLIFSHNKVAELQSELDASRAENYQLKQQIANTTESDSAPFKKLLYAVQNPNGNLQIQLKRTTNKLSDSEKLVTELQNTLSGLTKVCDRIQQDMFGLQNQSEPESQTEKTNLGSIDLSISALEKEINIVSTKYEQISELNINWGDFRDEVKRILREVELLLKIEPDNYHLSIKQTYCLEVINQLDNYINDLAVMERSISTQINILESRLNKLNAVKSELDGDTSIERIDIKVKDFSFIKLAAKPEVKVKIAKEKVSKDWSAMQQLEIPMDLLNKIANSNNLTVQEVLILTLYDLLPKDFDPKKNEFRSLFTLLWAAYRSKIISSPTGKSPDAIYAWAHTFSGKVNLFYEKHPQLRSYLEYKTLAGGMPAFRRTATSLPWEKSEIMHYELLSQFKSEVKNSDKTE